MKKAWRICQSVCGQMSFLSNIHTLMNAPGPVHLAQGYFGIKLKLPRIKPPTFLDLLSHLTTAASSRSPSRRQTPAVILYSIVVQSYITFMSTPWMHRRNKGSRCKRGMTSWPSYCWAKLTLQYCVLICQSALTTHLLNAILGSSSLLYPLVITH